MIISSGFSKFKNNKNTRLSSDLRQLEYNKMMRAAKAIQDTIQTYNKMKLRIAPKISVSWKFSRSFSMYINGIQYGYNLKNNLKKFRYALRKKDSFYQDILSDLVYLHANSNGVRLPSNRPIYLCPEYSFNNLFKDIICRSITNKNMGLTKSRVYLPSGFDYKKIKTVFFRWAKFNPKSIKVKFFKED